MAGRALALLERLLVRARDRVLACEQRDLARPLEVRRGRDRLADVAAGGRDPVMRHQHGEPVAERVGERLPELRACGRGRRCFVKRGDVRRHEVRALVRERLRAASRWRRTRSSRADGCARPSSTSGRRAMISVWIGYSMWRPAVPFEDLAVPAEQDHVLLGHLVEAEVAALQPDAAALGVADRDVTPDHVRLAGAPRARGRP